MIVNKENQFEAFSQDWIYLDFYFMNIELASLDSRSSNEYLLSLTQKNNLEVTFHFYLLEVILMQSNRALTSVQF